MYLEIFLADFAFFWEFRGISRKNLNFTGPRLREISEALIWCWSLLGLKGLMTALFSTMMEANKLSYFYQHKLSAWKYDA